jgi:hypothetical protein
MIPLLLAAVTIHTGFEGASLGRVEQKGPAEFECSVAGEKDHQGRNRQASWYFFRLDGAKGKTVTIDLVDLPGEYNYQPNKGAIRAETLPYTSDDAVTWKQVPSIEFDDSIPRLRFRVTPAADKLWVAHIPPYTTEDLARLKRDLTRSPDFAAERAGKSVEGRPIELWTITSTKQEPRRTIWLMFRQHAWESGTSWAAEGGLRYLVSDEARGLRERFVFRVFPMCDPDGVVHGGVRFNRNGYDLNRNWDVVDAERMPEITAQRKAIADWLAQGHSVDLFLSVHNDESPADHVDAPLTALPALRPIAEKFAANLARMTSSSVGAPRDSGINTTPGMKGRMAVYHALAHDHKIPAMLLELTIRKNAKLGRAPHIPDRLALGRGLIDALAEALAK